MVLAPGVEVPLTEAEATRRRLTAEGTLRPDLHPLKREGTIVFPTTGGAAEFEFESRTQRVPAYHQLLPDKLAAEAPRAFEAIGDIALLKVGPAVWEDRAAIGSALQKFLGARAVFHDHGVKGTYRVRDLERLVGQGDSETIVAENGVRLHVDVGKAYFSPRLADERGRIASLVVQGEHLVDMFGGVAPQGVQAAKAGARVTSIDLNPDALPLAERNRTTNRVDMDLHCGDARAVAANLDAADRVIMNLPHGASDFLDAAMALAKPGATIHLHEILANETLPKRQEELTAQVGTLLGVRHVRNYSATDSHVCFDLMVKP